MSSCKKNVEIENNSNDTFIRFFGTSSDDSPQNYIITPNGDIYICGSTYNAETDLQSFYITKVDKFGNSSEATFEQSSTAEDQVIVDMVYRNDTLFALGQTSKEDEDNSAKMIFMAFDENLTQYPNTVDTFSIADQPLNAKAILSTEDNGNGFYLIGETNSTIGAQEMFYIRLDQSLDSIFSSKLGKNNEDDVFGDIIELHDGEIAWTGTITDGNNTDPSNDGAKFTDLRYIKATENQGLLLDLHYTEFDDTYQTGNSIIQNIEQDVLILGSQYTNKNNKNVLLLKIDDDMPSGNETPIIYSNSELGTNAVGNHIIQTEDGGYIMAGTCTPPTSSTSKKQDMFLMKLNSDLSTDWVKTFGGTENDEALVVKETETKDGYILLGKATSNNDLFTVIKTNANGEVFGAEF